MFGPPSSPPVRVSTEQENELRNMLLPAFGHESPESAKSREAARSKVEVYRDNSASNNQPGFLPTPIPTSEANLQPSSPCRRHHMLTTRQSGRLCLFSKCWWFAFRWAERKLPWVDLQSRRTMLYEHQIALHPVSMLAYLSMHLWTC